MGTSRCASSRSSSFRTTAAWTCSSAAKAPSPSGSSTIRPSYRHLRACARICIVVRAHHSLRPKPIQEAPHEEPHRHRPDASRRSSTPVAPSSSRRCPAVRTTGTRISARARTSPTTATTQRSPGALRRAHGCRRVLLEPRVPELRHAEPPARGLHGRAHVRGRQGGLDHRGPPDRVGAAVVTGHARGITGRDLARRPAR